MKMLFTKKALGVHIGLAFASASLYGYGDNAHFYKAARFHGLTMHDTAKNKTKIDVEYGYGSARKGYDARDKKVELLDIYGLQNMLYLTSGVPILPSITTYHNLLTNLLNGSMGQNDFGKLSFRGKFRLHEANINVRHNIVDDIFAQVHLPIRSVRVNKISFQDKSPTTGLYNQNTAEWVQVKNNINTILNAYGFRNYNAAYEESSTGDLTLYLGWQSVSKGKVEFLKYMSAAIKVGVLFPTSQKDDINYAFGMSTGHNTHWGIPFKLDLMVGATEWLTIGAHAGALFFFDRTIDRRLKTNVNQSGAFKLAQGEVKFERGAVWEVGGNVYFDHFYKGLSAGLAYSYNRKEEDDLTAMNTSLFTGSTINNDDMYLGWTQHVIHLMAEYDFAPHMKDCRWEARVKLYYDLLADEKRAFDTDMFGFGVGADIKW